jgi:hypothetical protein
MKITLWWLLRAVVYYAGFEAGIAGANAARLSLR